MTLEERIKRHLAERPPFAGGAPTEELPSAEELYLYLTGGLSASRVERMEALLARDAQVRRFVDELRRLDPPDERSTAERVPSDWVESAARLSSAASGRCPACGRPARPRQTRAAWIDACWLAATAAAFAASFVMPRYFLQCLALGVLCGVKWIVNRRQTRTQILITQALGVQEGAEPGHLHRSRTKL